MSKITNKTIKAKSKDLSKQEEKIDKTILEESPNVEIKDNISDQKQEEKLVNKKRKDSKLKILNEKYDEEFNNLIKKTADKLAKAKVNNLDKKQKELITEDNKVSKTQNELQSNEIAKEDNDLIVKLENIDFFYNTKIQTLKNCSFSIKKGAFHAFIGENGAGKSTTIKLIVGLVKKYSGHIEINSLDPRVTIEARKGLCFIPDKAIFPSNWNVENFLLQQTLLNSNKDKPTLKKLIEKYLEQYDILKTRKKNPNNLSAGQKKKVLLIKAILDDSSLIILDEPAANLDPTSRIQFFNILKDLSRQDKTIFISSHILEEIKKYVNAATIISKGEIVFSGEVSGDELIKAYEEHVIRVVYSDSKIE